MAEDDDPLERARRRLNAGWKNHLNQEASGPVRVLHKDGVRADIVIPVDTDQSTPAAKRPPKARRRF